MVLRTSQFMMIPFKKPTIEPDAGWRRGRKTENAIYGCIGEDTSLYNYGMRSMDADGSKVGDEDAQSVFVGLRPNTFLYKQHKQVHSIQKHICIHPAGLKGFYASGVIAYIKENYNISDYIFSGASAGSWNALLFSYRKNTTDLIYDLLYDKQMIPKNESIRDFQDFMKTKILENYVAEDFDLDRIFIGVTSLNTNFVSDPRYFMRTSIYSNFSTLEDVLDCCIASSHIPILMGNFFHTYKNQISFDGGFSKYPFYSDIEPTLNITPNIWNHKKNILTLEDYTTMFSKEKYNFLDMFWEGYRDSDRNREYLDNIFR